jgi:hypothetical protein
VLVHRARGNDHGPAKRVPDEDDTLHAVLLQSGDPGQDIERTFGQDVGVTVAQPQGRNPFLTQRFREPRIGALTGPPEAPPGTSDPDHPVLRRRGRMQERLDVTPVRPQQHTLPRLAGVGRTGEDIVEANSEGVRVVRTPLVVPWRWHGQLLLVEGSGVGSHSNLA